MAATRGRRRRGTEAGQKPQVVLWWPGGQARAGGVKVPTRALRTCRREAVVTPTRRAGRPEIIRLERDFFFLLFLFTFPACKRKRNYFTEKLLRGWRRHWDGAEYKTQERGGRHGHRSVPSDRTDRGGRRRIWEARREWGSASAPPPSCCHWSSSSPSRSSQVTPVAVAGSVGPCSLVSLWILPLSLLARALLSAVIALLLRIGAASACPSETTSVAMSVLPSSGTTLRPSFILRMDSTARSRERRTWRRD